MKTKQELLNFYGVEMGKRYRIISATSELFQKLVGRIFQITETHDYFKITSTSGEYFAYDIDRLVYLNYKEYKPPILDDKEREYLQKYVMDNPAFKGKVVSIRKGCSSGYEYLRIILKNDGIGYLPRFKENSMYRNMNVFIDYTPKELGLKE